MRKDLIIDWSSDINTYESLSSKLTHPHPKRFRSKEEEKDNLADPPKKKKKKKNCLTNIIRREIKKRDDMHNKIVS